MTASFLVTAVNVTFFVQDEGGRFILVHQEKELPPHSLLAVPDAVERLMPPFNPPTMKSTWQGPSEPPMERG